jgi:hypothetical protein
VEVNLFGTTDEEYHRKLKRPVANAYSLTTLLSSEQAVDSCTQLLVSQLTRFADGNTPVDFGEWIQFYTFDTVGELTFGRKLGFLNAGSDVDGMIDAIENLLVCKRCLSRCLNVLTNIPGICQPSRSGPYLA